MVLGAALAVLDIIHALSQLSITDMPGINSNSNCLPPPTVRTATGHGSDAVCSMYSAKKAYSIKNWQEGDNFFSIYLREIHFTIHPHTHTLLLKVKEISRERSSLKILLKTFLHYWKELEFFFSHSMLLLCNSRIIWKFTLARGFSYEFYTWMLYIEKSWVLRLPSSVRTKLSGKSISVNYWHWQAYRSWC